MKFPNIDKCVDSLLNGMELEAILYKYIGIYQFIKLKDIIHQEKENVEPDEDLC